MEKPTLRVLVVDDYGPWRDLASRILGKSPELTIVGVAADGPEAVRKAQELAPDLILLDIGLPAIDGIEAARRIRATSLTSRILFLSENSAPDIVDAALSTPASGYVLKSDAARELLLAVEAVLQGEQFVGARLSGGGSATYDIEGSEGRQRPGVE